LERRDAVYKLGEKGLQMAIMFPSEAPPGWYIGTIVQDTVPKGKDQDKFWLNFTATGDKYKKSDDLKVNTTQLKISAYKEGWVMLCKEGTSQQFIK